MVGMSNFPIWIRVSFRRLTYIQPAPIMNVSQKFKSRFAQKNNSIEGDGEIYLPILIHSIFSWGRNCLILLSILLYEDTISFFDIGPMTHPISVLWAICLPAILRI